MVKRKYKQTGSRVSVKADRKRKAKAPGWRIAKKSRRRYFETRKNRSDKKGSRL